MSLLIFKTIVLVFVSLVALVITALSVKDAINEYRNCAYKSAAVLAFIVFIGVLTTIAAILATLKVWSML